MAENDDVKNSAVDILLNSQPPPHEAVTKTDPDINSQNMSKPSSINMGRPTIAEDINLQIEYMNLHFLRVGTGLTIAETAKVKGVSVSKVKKASEWVRDNFVTTSPTEYFADAEVLLNGRIKEITLEMAETKKGEPALDDMGKPYLLDGKPIVKWDKKHYRYLMGRRESYEKTLLNIRGLLHQAQFIQAKNVFTGDVTVMQKNVAVVNSMEPEDRAKFIELLDKYGKPPPLIE